MNEKLRKMIEEMVAGISASLNKMPESLQGELNALKEKLNQVLATMKPIDATPAALNAAYSIESLQGMMERMFEAWQETTARLGAMATKVAEQGTSLNKLTEIEGQIAAGKLMPEEKHLQLVEAAKQSAAADAVKAERESRKVVDGRLATLAKCGLPAAPEAIIVVDEAAWDKHVAEAKMRVEMLGKFNVTSKNAAELVTEAAWSTPEDWTRIERWAKTASEAKGAAGGAGTRSYAPGQAGGEPLGKFMPV
jgi:hypothetical protein